VSTAIEHFSRTRVENTTLQVIADTQRDLARLIHEEESVIRQYVQRGQWPHKSVNLFVFEDLQPLVSQIKNAALLSSVIAEDIDRRPMVNVYDAANPTECTVFVNRRALNDEGLWNDTLALRALLAHEHAHPLSENATVQAARALSVEVTTENRTVEAAVGGILHLLADRLCVHAPQEIFANEVVIRAGFGDALFHLDMGVVDKAVVGVAKRASLVGGLDKQVTDGKLTAEQMAVLLLVGDLQAYLGFALETAPFLFAKCDRQAAALETALRKGIWARLDPVVMPLYERFRDHYRQLKGDLGPADVASWAGQALVFLCEALSERSLDVRFELVPARSGQKRPHKLRSEPRNAHHGIAQHDEGSP
jgi:hypothetical protein